MHTRLGADAAADNDDDNNNNNNNNNKHWCEHVPESVETSQGGKITILWNQRVQTDRTVCPQQQTRHYNP